ncbi:MAG: hypothetical protein JNK04_07085 [Myxococcales bacterium]|nr:hypothetical protein [Myxococcales bacterium]
MGGGSGDGGFSSGPASASGLSAMIGGGAGDGGGSTLLGGPGEQFDMSKLTETLKHPFFDASSPDDQTVGWDGNEMSFYDQPGQQQLYMQAQKDMRQVIKDSMTTLVGNSRSAMVGTDDITWVGNRQQLVVGDNHATHIGNHRTVTVGATQTHIVTGDISLTGEANQSYTITEKWDTTAKKQEHTGEELILLKVGTSQIVMRPEFIIIQATDVFINPGEADTQAAIEQGTRPKPDHEKAQEAADKAAADAAANEQAFQDKRAKVLAEQEQHMANGGDYETSPQGKAEQAMNDAETPYDRAKAESEYEFAHPTTIHSYDDAVHFAESMGVSHEEAVNIVNGLGT